MKKKVIIILSVIVLSIFLIVCLITDFFRNEKLGNYIIKTDNVYEEIWNLAVKEEYGDSLLTSIGSDSYAKIMIGGLDYIYIDCGENDVMLRWQDGGLWISCACSDDCYWYVYKSETNTLYGEKDESFLIENFLVPYFETAGESTKYSLDNQGDYSFVLVESVFYSLP